jgi:predicted GNAT family acetyltransferase
MMLRAEVREEGMELTLRRYEDVRTFLDHAGSFLVAREAEHCLIIGISGTLRDHPELYPEPAYLAAVSGGEGIVAVATRTPPWNVVLSETEDRAAIDLFVEDLMALDPALRGVTGPKALAGRFATTWARATDRGATLETAERIFRLEGVRAPTGVAGSSRIAREADRSLIAAWLDAFLSEAVPDSPRPDDLETVADRWVRRVGRTAYLWEVDGQVVSFVGAGSPTPNGVRIGPVYTPPASRRRGFASALTAAASQAELDGGRRFCFLFTDLANPTSNHIYQEIGYEPVIDVDQYRFV